MNILIVDDNASNLKLLRAILEAEGHSVVSAGDGVEALAILDAGSIEVVISDVLMPRMDGYRLCYEVRRSERWRNLPFITYTATYTSQADERLCLDLGSDKYLRKPASAQEIMASVHEAVNLGHRPQPIALESTDVLRQYSERLVDKLEEKNVELEERTVELNSAHDQLRHLLAHSPALLYTLKIGLDGLTPTVVSDNVERLLGVTPAEATYEWWLDSLHPDDRERALATLRDAPNQGGYSMEYRVRHRDGSYLWIEDNNRLVADDSGEPKEMVGVWTDISRRKRTEADLKKSEERFREMLETVELIAMTLDTTGKVTFCNDYLLRLAGRDRDEVIGADWFDLFIGDSIPGLKEMYFETITVGTLPAHHENPIVTKSGELREIAWNNTTLRDASGRVTGSASIGEDITERKSLQEQLLQSQKMESLGLLAGGIAHDFNNMLTGILGYAELAEMKLPADSPIRSDLEEIGRAAERAASLTKQLLTFARKEVVDPQIVSLDELAGGLEGLLCRLLGEKIELIVIGDADLGSVRVDPLQFEQVLVNLAVNARDAMSGGGKLIVETRNTEVTEPQETHGGTLQPGSYVVVSISDNGSGMNKEIASQVFDPFFTTKEKGKGTGLGLSTCYGIVRNSGGHIWVYSEVGTGTTFRIYLPRFGEAANGEKSDAAIESACQGETVLVVEDEDTVRSLAVAVLAQKGYQVLEAQDGRSALDLVAAHREPIDLLITDVVMPGMNGRELAEVLKLVRPETSVLFISGYTDDAMVHQGVLDRDLAFLQKPFTRANLLRKVREVLDDERMAA